MGAPLASYSAESPYNSWYQRGPLPASIRCVWKCTMARILVIDDHSAHGEELVRLLGVHGYEVVVARDGVQALREAIDARPDLIIADPLTPEPDGPTLAAHLRADPKLAQVRLMFYTALELSAEVRGLAAAAGISHAPARPAEPEALLAMVRDALASPPAPPGDMVPLDRAYLRQVTAALRRHVETLTAEITARVQAEAALRAQTARLKLLADASHAFALASQDYPAMLEFVARTIAEALGDPCIVYMLAAENSAAPQMALCDARPAVQARLRRRWRKTPFSPERDPSTQGALADYGPVLLVPGGPQPCPLLGSLGAGSLIIAPLWAERGAIGLLYVLRCAPERPVYTADDMQLVQELADRAALAIRNGQLVAQLQAQLRQRPVAEAEMRRLNSDLSDSQARLASIIDSAMDAIVTVDDAQQIVMWNAAAERMFGCPASEAYGGALDRFIPELHRAAHRAHVQAFGHTGVTARAMGALRPLAALHVNGSEFPIEASVSSVVVGARRLFTVILRDISARLQAETALRSSEDRFAKIFQLSSVAMVISAAEGGQILEINQSFERFSGYARAELLGRAPSLLGLWHDPAEQQRVAALLQTQGTVHNIEVGVRVAGGQRRDVILSIDPLQLGEQRCLISSLHNISERKQSELVLQATTQQLKDLSRRLVAIQEAERRNIARELHDEIGQMLTGLNLLLEAGASFSHSALVERLHEAQGLVTDLTARVRRLSLDLRPSMLDDLGLLPTLIWYFERYTSQTQVQVAFKHRGLDAPLDPLIAVAVYRVVQEALTNVARHAHVAEVIVSAWTQGGLIVLSIEDRGVGFDFEAALAARRSSGITGMRERVALLDGQLMVDTGVGRGTHILAELPLQRAAQSEGGIA